MDEVHYIEVLVPLRLSWTPTYSAPEALRRGTRVTVGFSGRRYSGVVWRNVDAPGIDPSRIRPVTAVNSELRPVSEEELRLWEFLSSYYLCTPGEVFKAAFPAGKVQSERTAANVLERLRQRLAIRQEALSRRHRDDVRARLEAERDAIAARIASLTALPVVAADAQVSPEVHCPVPPTAKTGQNVVGGPDFSTSGDTQKDVSPVSGRTGKDRSDTKPLLLIGPGRETLYLEKCEEALAQGYNVLILSPEIAASESLTQVFEKAFPGVVHRVNSHMTPVRRRMVADDIRRFGGQIVIGTRSAIFLPFSRLGLIIVENEQDILFKQTEPAPRYNARDVAVVLGRIHSSPVILGSPAPSLESLHNARTGKYGLLALPASTITPTFIDISAERRKNGMPGRLSYKLIEAAARTEGPLALIRGWEKEEELREEASRAFPGLKVDIMTLSEARLTELGGYALVAVVQADAMMGQDDFRADERALQALAMLRESVRGTLVIQTAKPEHPVFGDTASVYERLLEERKAFSLPPFTRIVDTAGPEGTQRYYLKPDASLQARKQEILDKATAAERGGRERITIDVDPIS